ncbi:hypothetical protein ACU635_00540 [[Actinomadura] parvosata]|uniref:hypothetical protein n=1 Tax=[Actinomadura] parvosata TaxID=1955412 RepID=UPI00406C9447
MKALGLGVLTGVLVATVAVSLVFALTDRPMAPSAARAALVGETGEAGGPAGRAVTPPPGEGRTPEQDPSAEQDPTPEQDVSAEQDPTPEKADFAGRVTGGGGGGLVALSVRDGKAVGYFWDGRREVWMSGDARGDRATLQGGRALMTADLGTGAAKGKLVLGEDAFRFTAPAVERAPEPVNTAIKELTDG